MTKIGSHLGATYSWGKLPGEGWVLKINMIAYESVILSNNITMFDITDHPLITADGHMDANLWQLKYQELN